MKSPPEEWLAALNAEFRKRGVPPRRRPMIALQRWMEERGVSLRFDSPLARSIFAWFDAETGGRSNRNGPFYTAAHYFDAVFWPLEIPLVYGETRVNPLRFLRMPPRLRSELAADEESLHRFLGAFADWYDYALSLDDLRKPRLEGLAGDLIAGAARDVESATLGLLGGSMNQNVAVLSRSATEKHLKFSLVYRAGANEHELRRLSHNLEAIIDRVVAQIPQLGETCLDLPLSRFPAHNDRYRELSATDADLWQLYEVAKRVGVACIRLATGRSTRASGSPA